MHTFIFTTFTKVVDAAKKYVEGTSTNTGSSGVGTGLRWISLGNEGVKGFFGDNVIVAGASNDRLVGQYEHSRSNVLSYSLQFEHTDWIKESGSILVSAACAPDGTFSANKFIETSDALNVLHFMSQSFTPDGNSEYAYSVYAKYSGSNRHLMLSSSSGSFSGSVQVGYNLQYGVITTISGTPVQTGIESAGDDWYRCWYSLSSINTRSIDFSICLSSGSSMEYGYQGDGTGGIYLWNAQLEVGAFPSSPMPTGDNLFTFCRDFTEDDWTVIRAGVSGNIVSAPDGTFTADKLVADNDVGGTTHFVRQSDTPDGSSQYCFSVYAKAEELSWIRIELHTGGFPTSADGFFDITNGSLGTLGSGIDDSGIEDVGNGWYRCWVVATSDAATVSTHAIYLAIADNDTTFNADGKSGVYLWNAQVEVGAYPGPPIFTEATEVSGSGPAIRGKDAFYWEPNTTDPLPYLREKFAFKYRPEFNSNMPHSAAYLWDFQDSQDEYNTRAFLSTDNYIKIEDQDNNEFVTIKPSFLSWSRGNELEFICEPLSGTLELRGFISGNGIYQGDPWPPRDGDVNWGGTDKPVDGVMTEPYNLATKYELAEFDTGVHSNSSTRWLASTSSVAGVAGPILPDAGVSGSYHGRDFGQFEYGAENLLSASQNFNSGSWTKTRCGISSSIALAPDGTLTADKLVEDSTAANSHFITQNCIPDGASSYTYSVYAKAAERTWMRLEGGAAGYVSTISCYFDLVNVVVGTEGGGIDDSGIEDVGNGWYRCWISITSDSATTSVHRIYLAEGDADVTYDGDGASGIYVWNAQLEVGDYPSSPILNGENLFTYSDQLDQGDWGASRTTVTPNAAIAPNGTLTAYLAASTNVYGNHRIYQDSLSVDGASQYCFSIYIKAAGYSTFRMQLSNTGFPDSGQGDFDIDNLTVENPNNLDDYGIEDVGNGWYRCWVAITSDAVESNANLSVYIRNTVEDSLTYIGNDCSGIYAWGAQVERSSKPGAYIRTEASTVTTPQPREKDVFFWNDQEISSQMRKKFMLQFVPNYSKTQMSQSLATLWDFNEFGDNIKFKAQLSSSGELFVSGTSMLPSSSYSGSYVSASGLDWDRGDTLTTIFDPAEGMIKTTGFGTGSQTVWEEPWSIVSGTLYWGMSSSQESQINGLMTKPLQAPAYPHSVYLDDMVASSSVERIISVSGTTGPGVLRPYNAFNSASFATVTLNDFIFVQSEMSSSNALTKAQQFSDSVWTKTRTSISGNAVIAPDGTLTADKLTEAVSAELSHELWQNRTPDGVSPYCFSVYAKAAERSWMRLLLATNAFPGNAYSDFNIETGVLGTKGAGADVAGIEPIGNGWYRCWVVATSDSAAATNFYIYMMEEADDLYYVGDGVSSIYLWNAQLEKSKFPTSPIHTGENFMSYSRDFTQWGVLRAGISGNLAIAPDGTLTADKLVEDSSDNDHRVRQWEYGDGSSVYCFSVYAKAAERNWLQIRYAGGWVGTPVAYFDIANGEVGDTTAGIDDSGIDDIGDGWWRCWTTATSNAVNSNEMQFRPSPGDLTGSYQGDGKSGLYLWNAQFEKTDNVPGPPINILAERTLTSVVSRSITKISASAGSYSRNTLRNQFKLKFIPYFDHDVYTPSSENPRIISWCSSGEEYNGTLLELFYSSSATKFIVRQTTTGEGPINLVRVSSSAVTFNRGQEITFTINPANEMLALSGCLTGDGSYFGPSSWIDFLDDSTANMYLGSNALFTSQSNGLVSLPIITNTPITEKLTMVTSANPFALWHADYGLVYDASSNRVTGWDDQWNNIPATQSVGGEQPLYNPSTKRVEFDNNGDDEWLSLSTMSGSPANWSLVAALDERDSVSHPNDTYLLAAENIKFYAFTQEGVNDKIGYWTSDVGDQLPSGAFDNVISKSQTIAYVLESGSYLSRIRRNGGALSSSYDYPVSHSIAGDDLGLGSYGGDNGADMHLRFLALYQGSLSVPDLAYVENLAMEEMGQVLSVPNKLAQVTSVIPISLWHAKYGVHTGSVGNVEYWFDQWGTHHGYQSNVTQRPGYNSKDETVLFDASTQNTMPLDFTTPEDEGDFWFVFGIKDTSSGSNPGPFNYDAARYFETEDLEISLYRNNNGTLGFNDGEDEDEHSSSLKVDLTGSHVASFLLEVGSDSGQFRFNGQNLGSFQFQTSGIDGSASLGSRAGLINPVGKTLGRTFDGEIKFAAIYSGIPSDKDLAYVEKVAMDEMFANETNVLAYFDGGTYLPSNPKGPRYMSVVSGGVTGQYLPSVPPTRYLYGHRFIQSELAVINHFSHSNDFGHANWTKTRSGISSSMSASFTTVPDGLGEVNKLVEDSSFNTHFTKQNYTVTSGSTYCFSVYAKAAERTWMLMRTSTGYVSVPFTNFDLENGAIGVTQGGTNRGIDDVGNGWWRCWMTSDCDGSTSSPHEIYPMEIDNSKSYQGDGASGIYLWNAQLEVVANDAGPTSPIVTGENLFTHSRLLVENDWTKSKTGISSSLVIAPDGTLTADKFVDDTLTGWHYMAQTITPDGSSTYCLSVYAKEGEHNWLALRFQATGWTSEYCYFDLTNGTIGSSTMDDEGIEVIGDGWYRCWVTATSVAADASLVYLAIAEADGDMSFAGNGMDGFYIWSPQLEIGDFPGTPVITQASAISTPTEAERDLDKFYWEEADVPSTLRTDKFSFQWIPQADNTDATSQYLVSWYNGDTATVVSVYYNPGTDTIRINAPNSDVGIAVESSALTFSRNQILTITVDPTEGSLRVQGAASGDGKSVGVPWKNLITRGAVYWGHRWAGGNQINGLISEPYKGEEPPDLGPV